MKKYKLRPQYNGVLDTVLKNRNLTQEQANIIIDPPEDVIIDPLEMKNMEYAISRLKHHIDNNSKIGTIVDNDVDGFASSSMLYNVIKKELKYENIMYFIHNKNKAHGLEESIVKEVIDSKIDLLFLPDSGCSKSDEQQQQILTELGIEMIILDHHVVECKDRPNVTIVNPKQPGDTTNEDLSGAGVTYKFIQAFCREYYPDIDHTEYIDLFALSLVSDMMNMMNLENRMYYNVGSTKEYIRNSLILEYIDNKKLEGEYLTIEMLGFSIAPYINAVVRLGTKEERELMFKALAYNPLVSSNKRGNQGQMVLASEEALRISNNIKSRQDKQKKEGAAKVLDRIKEQGLMDNKIVICDVTDILSPSLTGLAANTILNELQRPIILYRNKNGACTGSARNYGTGISDLKEFCKSTSMFEFCSGHANAFGLEMKEERIIDISNKFNELLKDIDFSSEIEIDGMYEKEVPFEDVQEIANYGDLWCNTIKEPKFLIKGIKIHTKDIQKTGNATYKFMYNGCYYIKNFGSKAWYENFSNPDKKLPFGGEIEIELLCRFRKNHKGFYYIDIIETTSTIN